MARKDLKLLKHIITFASLFWKFSNYVPKDNQRNEMWGLLEIPYVGNKQERGEKKPLSFKIWEFENFVLLRVIILLETNKGSVWSLYIYIYIYIFKSLEDLWNFVFGKYQLVGLDNPKQFSFLIQEKIL